MSDSHGIAYGKRLPIRLATDPQLAAPPRPAVAIVSPGSGFVGDFPPGQSVRSSAESAYSSGPTELLDRTGLTGELEDNGASNMPRLYELMPARSLTSPAVLGSIIATLGLMIALVWLGVNRSESPGAAATEPMAEVAIEDVDVTDRELPYITADPLAPEARASAAAPAMLGSGAATANQIVLGPPPGNERPLEVQPDRVNRR
jgi:hypothetical protein